MESQEKVNNIKKEKVGKEWEKKWGVIKFNRLFFSEQESLTAVCRYTMALSRNLILVHRTLDRVVRGRGLGGITEEDILTAEWLAPPRSISTSAWLQSVWATW